MMFKRHINKLLPVNSRRRNLAKLIIKANQKQAGSISYENWIRKVEPKLFLPTKTTGPLVSIVVPCYNTPQKYFAPLLESVKSQTYEQWQLCVVDASTDVEIAEGIKQQCDGDERVVYKRLKKNLGISGNTNAGIEIADGEFIGLLDHDDTLSPHALNEVVSAIGDNPKADVLYSDEDKLSDDGKARSQPFFKPDWSPELLLGVNYVTHFLVARKSLLHEVKKLRPDFDGAQDYDLILRLSESARQIVHIPKVLYHWRLAEGSTAKTVNEKDYATAAGRKALAEALGRRGINAEALEVPGRPTNYRPKYALGKKPPSVSIIIPFKDKIELLRQCVPSILQNTTYQNYEIILVSNNSQEQATFDYLNQLKQEPHCKLFEWNYPFNYSAVNNFARAKASGSYLVFLNNDTEVVTPGWLDELIGVASQKDIGAVGPLLFYPNQTIQHAGVVLGMGGMAGHVFRFRHKDEWTDFGLTTWPRNYLAVTGACLAVQAKKFDAVGGFDEQLQIGGNDIALCLSLYKKGWRNVFWPFAELIHYENMSVGPYSKSVPIEDYNRSLEYYRPYLEKGDPYFNPNLSLNDEAVTIRSYA